MEEHHSKKNYDPPKVKSVSFCVDEGFLQSQFQGLSILPFSETNSNLYSSSANSGSSFWGGENSSSSGQSGSYSPWDWHWNN